MRETQGQSKNLKEKLGDTWDSQPGLLGFSEHSYAHFLKEMIHFLIILFHLIM